MRGWPSVASTYPKSENIRTKKKGTKLFIPFQYYRSIRVRLDLIAKKRMYPPPSPAIIEKLIWPIVELISFGKYVIHISLENRDQVSVACPFRFDTEEAVMESFLYEFPLSNSNLPRVIGTSVDQAKCDSDGTLRLRFTNGDRLIAYANDPQYEAYTLSIAGKEYVV